MINSKIKILVTGGGSGGHISVAKALMEGLEKEYSISTKDIIYIGGDLGMEEEKNGNSLEQKVFQNSSYTSYFIRAGKLQRHISLKSILLLFRTLLAFKDSFLILRKENPTFIISTGGFVSVPVCIVGWFLKKPIYLHEQTASVGISNKIVSKFAKKIFVSFKHSLKYFNIHKSFHVGNVVRKDIFKKKQTNDIDLEIISLVNSNIKLPFIYISGGSLGSHSINEKMKKSLKSLLASYRILLQTGDNKMYKDFDEFEKIKKELSREFQNRFVVKKYINSKNIGYVLNSMDLFVGRSGANTVYEIGVLRKYALFIPIPWVTHNEQYLNAKVLQSIGTANILEEKDLEKSNLKTEIDNLLKEINVRKIDSEKLKSFFPTNALYKILEQILSEYQE
jgi:UDP-N-acetylglucosamine--N-acetylmuramyl-(pentapeptide) pyrophosphoryl-undecaprenol N-acetylglucosamine transferase